MSAAFVLDCSVTMTWLIEEEVTPLTRKIMSLLDVQSAVVPSLWVLEVVNTLNTIERRQRSLSMHIDAFIDTLRTLDIQIDNQPPMSAFSSILPLCRAHDLTAYDAAYLELAQRRKLPLATLDNDLRAAAKALGVKLLGK